MYCILTLYRKEKIAVDNLMGVKRIRKHHVLQGCSTNTIPTGFEGSTKRNNLRYD